MLIFHLTQRKNDVSKRHRPICCDACKPALYRLKTSHKSSKQAEGRLRIDKNGDDIRAKTSHSASICFRRVQMKRSITKPYFFTPEKSTILPFAPCEASYRTFLHPKKVRFYPSCETSIVLFRTRKKYDFTLRSVRDLISYFFTLEKSTILLPAIYVSCTF